MTAAKNTATLSIVDTAPADLTEQQFKPFSWYNGDANTDQTFIETVRDATVGLEELMGLIADDGMRADDGLPPRLSRASRCKIERMMIATVRLLHTGADGCIERSNEIREWAKD